MKSARPASPPKWPGEVLVFSGVTLTCGYILTTRILFKSYTDGPIFAGRAALHHALSFEAIHFSILFLSAVLTVVGTISLLRRKPFASGTFDLATAGFVAIGIVGSCILVSLCASLGVELVFLAHSAQAAV